MEYIGYTLTRIPSELIKVYVYPTVISNMGETTIGYGYVSRFDLLRYLYKITSLTNLKIIFSLCSMVVFIVCKN